MSIMIGRHINDITINPLEFLLTDSGYEMLFASEEEAINFLKRNGFSDEHIEWMEFIEVENEIHSDTTL